MTVTLTATGLEIEGHHVPVYSGTIHYWRLERDRWALILDRAKELGFNMIETYIPWSIHEIHPGYFDWGQDDPRKDVEAFMKLCEEKGLWLLVRPGPLINAELTDFGFPEWVLLDPDVQARTAVGGLHLDAMAGLHPPHQFPVPSYASEKFFFETGTWFDAICPIMARHLAPRGCIVAVQSDNETCYLFHDQPYATDYSVDSIKLYRHYLGEKYTSIEHLNAAYCTEYDTFDQVEAPRACEVHSRSDLPRHVDWIAYKEYQIRYAVARFARMLKERGLVEVPIFHDVAYQMSTPLDIAALEAEPDIDWVGMNLYRNQEDYWGAVQRIRYLVGTTRLPFVPEFGNGLWSHHPATFTPEEEEFITLAALMHGLKALNFYMLVERERWQGCPITRHGTYRPEYAQFYERLSLFLRDYPLEQFERERQVLVLFNFDLFRQAAALTRLHYPHVDLLNLPQELFQVDPELNLKHDVHFEGSYSNSENWLGRLLIDLAVRHVDYDLSDTHLNAARLSRYPIVYLQATDFMSPQDQSKLLAYVQNGGQLIVGPEMPYLDAALRPASVLGQSLQQPGTVAIGQGQLTWAPAEALASVPLPQPEYQCDQPLVEVTVQRRNGTTLLFLANSSAQPVDAQVMFDGSRTFRSAWGETQTKSGENSTKFSLPAYSVRIWEAA
ncbi:MAG TPA: beta-galactosidase [Anaerolineae bacterium]|nr:beta-galactosidase [Anaerolineae bacterium]